jgi:hypothetical protein
LRSELLADLGFKTAYAVVFASIVICAVLMAGSHRS